MSLDQARVFARVLSVPLEDVLQHAGVLDETEARAVQPGFAESDAVPFAGKGSEGAETQARAEVFGGGKPGIDIWTVKSLTMSLGGYLPGDTILVDTHQSERCKAGDVILGQSYNWQTGTAETILRRYEPPVLVAASADPLDGRVLVVDGNNVVIRGKVVASWRG